MNELRECINNIEPTKPVFTFVLFEDQVVSYSTVDKDTDLGDYNDLLSSWNIRETFKNNRFEIDREATYTLALENLMHHMYKVFDDVSPYKHTRKSVAYKEFRTFMGDVDLINNEELTGVFLKIYKYYRSGTFIGTAEQHRANIWHLLEAVVSKYGK